jgi:outer membrane lipoprotein-sorting protein
MTHRYSRFFMLILIILTPTLARAEQAGLDEALQKIVDQVHAGYEKIEDLEAQFVQTVEIMDFNVPYVSKGTLYIKKGKMLWDYVEPGRQQIFVDGGGFLYYVPDHKQVIRSKIGGQSDAHLPLKLLAGRAQLDQDFDIVYEIEAPLPGEPIRLRLVPKKNMGLIKIVITLVTVPHIEGLMIDEVVLHEKNGNVSTSSFEKIEINRGLDDATFVFKVPDGVEVLDAP